MLSITFRTGVHTIGYTCYRLLQINYSRTPHCGHPSFVDSPPLWTLVPHVHGRLWQAVCPMATPGPYNRLYMQQATDCYRLITVEPHVVDIPSLWTVHPYGHLFHMYMVGFGKLCGPWPHLVSLVWTPRYCGHFLSGP